MRRGLNANIDAGQLDVTPIVLARYAGEDLQRLSITTRNVVCTEALELGILSRLAGLYAALQKLWIDRITPNRSFRINDNTGIATVTLPRGIVPLDQAIRLERTVTV
ncbi:hypothetical protein [Marinobacter fonticola]|uniref:hypothetical protein n=1 Tax=Marinobacter fonticola TaxID=2603215 RepID=UPI0011E7A5AA|nr:hypothetical protein [Marinobacter fonticola]